MQIAVHLRNPDQVDKSKHWLQHFLSFHDRVFRDPLDRSWEAAPEPSTIYIGDEFCPQRLPSVDELKTYCQLSRESGSGLSLLTPVLSDLELDARSGLFDALTENHPSAEVVVNDWGLLFFLKRRYPSMRVGAGRLFNKGFKDPRLMQADKLAALSNEAQALLNDCSFNHDELKQQLSQLDVARLEHDLFPYDDKFRLASDGLSCSVYFPFGYVTTGRVCWVAAFDGGRSRAFKIGAVCSRPCRNLTLELRHAEFAMKVFQSGNTIFYLYTPSMLNNLFKRNRSHDLRLVYQGYAMGI